jgi:hypothetical protein
LTAHSFIHRTQAEKLTAVEQSNLREQQNYVAARQELLAQIEQVGFADGTYHAILVENG